MDARKSTIFVFQFVKPILQTVTHLIQYRVFEIQFWSVKCTTVTVRYDIYLFKVYIMSIIVLLKNNLTNICSKISKIEINFWMVYTCNMKSSGKDERWEEGKCTLHP